MLFAASANRRLASSRIVLLVPLQYERHIELLRQNGENQITAAEREELSDLRQAADWLMLRKAYAWSILRWRGARIPALEELSVPL